MKTEASPKRPLWRALPEDWLAVLIAFLVFMLAALGLLPISF
jgi:hypothetical protein